LSNKLEVKVFKGIKTKFWYLIIHVLSKSERNLNPKAACLKRREEEKAEDGPKIPQHHLLQQAPYPALPVSLIKHLEIKLNSKFYLYCY
jgi:hypothetical protein